MVCQYVTRHQSAQSIHAHIVRTHGRNAGPPTVVLLNKGIRQIKVVERHKWLNAMRKKAVYNLV
jgi:hypothetical protein